MKQAAPRIDPLDAWRRVLDVVIASAPVGYGPQVIQQLQDALRSYQQQGPIQRVTVGERKTCNQLTYLAVGQLILCAPRPRIDSHGFPSNAKVIGHQRFDDGGYVHTPAAAPDRPTSAQQLLQRERERLATSQQIAIYPDGPDLPDLNVHRPSQLARPTAAKPVPAPGSGPLPVTTVPRSSHSPLINKSISD
ncbi:hypothetical protein [uncultured Halopseudomonas sp.]|uniref:hypothetical protein n=1 Tax=uncultured Halopseudomonas sp. TaxID=2901193 RepID=UPI0030EE41C4|tara:strand:+ start:7874 stop:8449 length:576 start_codon:yes stop_codon:yes gene_type:complete